MREKAREKAKSLIETAKTSSSNNLEVMRQSMSSLKNKETKDKYLTLMQMVKKYNYPIEKHVYMTEDFYYNTAFRINGPRGTNAKDNLFNQQKKPVLLY